MRTKVVHSETKPAWNIVGTEWGGKYKIARFPYEPFYEKDRAEACKLARIASDLFNVIYGDKETKCEKNTYDQNL